MVGGVADAFNALLAVDQRQEAGGHAFLIKTAETWPFRRCRAGAKLIMYCYILLCALEIIKHISINHYT